MLTSEEIFDECVKIYEILKEEGKEEEARNELLKLLNKIENKTLYPLILNHLIRNLGLYPYMNSNTSILEDRFLLEYFKVDIIREKEPKVLHKEQSRILKRLLNNENLVLSAPTSFGKSFIIDVLIAKKQPKNVLIILPTISLLDETRRRLVRKFPKYHIITTSGVKLKEEKNILILTQERVLEYLEFIKNKELDLFIVDEFYKISTGDSRAHILQKVIKEFSGLAKQRYYLCPNINEIKDDSRYKFLEGMECVLLDFKTVVLEIENLSEKEENKYSKLKNILEENINEKTMIYVKSKKESKSISEQIQTYIKSQDEQLKNFSHWLKKHYCEDWEFAERIENGIAQHNGALHRFIQQLQVKLFSENEKMNVMVTTTSLIEGVNIPAKNIILWDDLVGQTKLSSLQYKNIIGRCGRMFKYFVGKVYLLEKVDEEILKSEEKLDIESESEFLYRNDLKLNDEQKKNEDELKKVIQDNNKFNQIITKIKNYSISMKIENIILIAKYREILATSINLLNEDNPQNWGFIKSSNIKKNIVSKIFNKDSMYAYDNMIAYAKYNYKSVQEVLNLHPKKKQKSKMDAYFQMEQKIGFEIANFFKDLEQIMQILCPEKNINISTFIVKVSNVFLPSVIYSLEEFGLPRMICKKLQTCNFINFEDKELTLEQALDKFKQTSVDDLIKMLSEKQTSTDEEKSSNDKLNYHDFDEYILRYFYEGLGVK